MIIYVSAPFTIGDVAQNVRNACLAGDELLGKGHLPVIPHLTHFWHLISPKPYVEWMRMDCELLGICDAILRLPGESKGADMEVAQAKQNCQLIYYSLDEVPDVSGAKRVYNWTEIRRWVP